MVHDMKTKETDIARNEKKLIRYKPVICSMREDYADETKKGKDKSNPKE